MLSTADIKERIVEELMETLEDIGVVVPGISGSDELSALGISSMLYARLVLRLEAEFGVEVGEYRASSRSRGASSSAY